MELEQPPVEGKEIYGNENITVIGSMTEDEHNKYFLDGPDSLELAEWMKQKGFEFGKGKTVEVTLNGRRELVSLDRDDFGTLVDEKPMVFEGNAAPEVQE